jgi:hypothetical protein
MILSPKCLVTRKCDDGPRNSHWQFSPISLIELKTLPVPVVPFPMPSVPVVVHITTGHRAERQEQ